jgi:para-nitrobenzyl esterase
VEENSENCLVLNVLTPALQDKRPVMIYIHGGGFDLVKSLKWGRNNIANFGGDPSNVTIFGESGGGAKITSLMAMPEAKDLFHRAIIGEGSKGVAGQEISGRSRKISRLTTLYLGL